MESENNKMNAGEVAQGGVGQVPQNNVGAEMDAALKVAEAPAQENVMTQGVPSDMGSKSDSKPVGEKSKISKKQIVGLVVLSLIAIGGVLFGVYGMNSQNEQIAQLTVRATDAEGKVAQLETEKITITDPDGGTTEITDSVLSYQNPVIKASSSDQVYTITYVSPTKTNGFYNRAMNIQVKDGEIVNCDVGVVVESGILYSQDSGAKTCEISGVEGDIYKIIDFGAGQDAALKYIGIIMTNGVVHYLSFKDALGGEKFDASNTLNVNGVVADAINVNASVLLPDGQTGSGYFQTVFVLSNGSTVEFDESML